MQEMDSDLEWVTAFQSGKTEAFDPLVLKYKQMIFSVCYRYFGNYDEANDCAQDSFLKAYMGLPKFKAQSKFKTWLYRIAVNTCLNRKASSSYSKEVSQGDHVMESSDGDPLTDLKNKRLKAQIDICLNGLQKDHRVVVILRDIDGMAYDDISQVLQKNLGTIKSKLARARLKLKTCLQGALL